MKSSLFLSLVLTCATWVTARAQQSLEELVSEAGTGWMMGKWEATTDQGSTITLTFSWDLDKKVIVLHGQGPEMEFKGYTAVDPASRDIQYVGFDNRGSVSKGKWAPEGDGVALRVESRGTDGNTRKMAAVFGGSEKDGLELRMHGIEPSGELSSPARATLKFKRKK